MKTLFLFSFMLFLFSFNSFSSSFTMMSYNVENLFDTKHDIGKEDFTYLPLELKRKSDEIQKYCNSLSKESWKKSCLNKDWNEKVYLKKIKNISRVIKSYRNGPDILVLQEVENKNVLNDLVKIGLKDSSYKFIELIEGPDKRGIDIGIISRFPIQGSTLHPVLLGGEKRPTRGILEVSISVGGKVITVFGNHWPSLANPEENRLKASEVLLEKALRAHDLGSDLVIATGDFNSLDNGNITGLNSNIYPYFNDIKKLALAAGKKLWKGSHWYRGSWSNLDRIFTLKKSGINFRARNFKIHVKRFMLGKNYWTDRDTGKVTIYKGVPARFNDKSLKGFSDHLPLVMSFNLK